MTTGYKSPIFIVLGFVFFMISPSQAADKKGGMDCTCHGQLPGSPCTEYKCPCAAPNGPCPTSSGASGVFAAGPPNKCSCKGKVCPPKTACGGAFCTCLATASTPTVVSTPTVLKGGGLLLPAVKTPVKLKK